MERYKALTRLACVGIKQFNGPRTLGGNMPNPHSNAYIAPHPHTPSTPPPHPTHPLQVDLSAGCSSADPRQAPVLPVWESDRRILLRAC